MVEQIRDLLRATRRIAGDGGEGDFDAFFADLLGDPRRAFGDEAGAVAGGVAGGDARGDDLREVGEPARPLRLAAEAALGTEVAGRPFRIGADEEGVAVAILMDGGDAQAVAAGLALLPEPAPGPAEEGGEAALQRRPQRLL